VEILEQLPERVTALEVQIVQLRDEMRSEFSATRAMIRDGDEGVVNTLLTTLREEIRDRLARLGYERLDDWAGVENLEERVDGEDKIDPFVLERLRARSS
jgi:uncharacterized Ntn-hydrolase superfamily protein